MIDYKSPIELTFEDMAYEIAKDLDNEIYRAISRCNVNVNEEELIKALQYDRGQYYKGYQDGYQDGLNADKWIPCEVEMPNQKVGTYLVTRKIGYESKIDIAGLWHGKWSIRGWEIKREDIIAWMPLPKTYMKEGAEDEL